MREQLAAERQQARAEAAESYQERQRNRINAIRGRRQMSGD